MPRGLKVGGRTKGTLNKNVAPIREKFQALLDGYSIDDMLSDLRALDPSERLKIVTGLSEFIIPKLQRSEIKAAVEYKEVQTFTLGGRKIIF